ncbi:VWA domain-containing protein [Nocardia cyriacigeorgica]|uniref:VWA domain-containing protein n=1 Tax=Nocardia cyriacigeorgica TaxID=135487 RepID=UPI0013BA1633|nr:VWA domain-containing protein [Nocardia cyriacigeorgica]NEW52760.1 VWA domain-containing protein [Nocardia cyriacigeorgica]
MTHNLGRVVADGRTLTEASGIDLVPASGPVGPARFVILHFDNVNLTGGAELTVDLGYGQDVFSAGSGATLWTRPADPGAGPIRIRIVGGTGTARLRDYGVGEPSITPGQAPGTSIGSQSNPDVFLHTSPYQEPIYETRLECNPGFAWRNAACSLAPAVPDSVKNRVKAATGIIVEVHDGHVSSCTGTLIGADLFLTARHCLTDPSREDLRSASVTFDYHPNCDGTRPAGHGTRFFKVLGEVASGSPPTGSNPPVSTDWVVLRLDAAPGALPAPLPMRSATLMNGETIFTMHHPNGAAKKTQAGVHDGGTISGFDFAGGSSGSSLFDVNGQVVGGPLASGAGCGVSFAPIANVIAGLSTPPPPPAPMDVMVVLDRSGSMSSSAPPVGRSKLDEAKDAAALFVQLVRENGGDRLGLATYSSTSSIDTQPAATATAKPALVGPPPFTTGTIGAITANGATSIGAGLGSAQLALTGGPADNAILLLTDGLQNTAPTIQEIEPHLGATEINAIGFGSDADIDAALLNRLAHDHGGHFTRALDGLSLRKFFGLAFGNMFESGALTDPDFLLPADKKQSEPHRFDVCGEERITVILGWDDLAAPLRARVSTPSGKVVGDRRIQPVRGRSWLFWRIPLPYESERDGTWQCVVDRVPTGGEFPPPPTDVRYFFLVVCSGGPKLTPLVRRGRVYTGDTVDPMVGLHYRDRTTPHGAQIMLTIDAPGVALGELTTQAKLSAPVVSSDPVGSFHATLQAIAQSAGGTLPVATSTFTVPLFDDGTHGDGAMEPDGIFNNPLPTLTKAEGTYHFRAVATYGDRCRASREAHWSIHVEPGIDPGTTGVVFEGTDDNGVLVITPRDPYGNPIGPGRGHIFEISPIPGVQIRGKAEDRGDGSYGVPVIWDTAITPAPGVVVRQPERDPVILEVPNGKPPSGDCTGVAEDLLECIGLPDPDVKRVRIKKVVVEMDLDQDDCGC